MTTIAEMLRRVNQVNLRAEVPKIIESQSRPIIDLNQKQLYEKSIDADGQPLRLYASASYSLLKEKRNSKPGFGRPDLYDTGAFFKGFRVYAGFTGVVNITSLDSKTPKLTNKYGSRIFGLTTDSRRQYISVNLRPAVQSYITRITKLRFNG